MTELADLDPRQAQVVELRYFGGLSEDRELCRVSGRRGPGDRAWQDESDIVLFLVIRGQRDSAGRTR